MRSTPALLTRLPLLDDILEQHSAQLAADFTAYRNHAYRVANFCCALTTPDAQDAISIAAAFHDIGIWTDGTFDYLEPSRRRARDWIEPSGHRRLRGLVDSMIGEHHKVRRYRGPEGALVERFRQADLADVSAGLIAANLPRSFLSRVFDRFPNAGFHRLLLRCACRHFVQHPFNPLPMMRW